MKHMEKLNSLLTASAIKVVLNDEVMHVSSLTADEKGPLLYTPGHRDADLKAWLEQNRALVNRQLHKHGGILFRGFNLATPELFREASLSVNEQLMEYVHRSSPRTQVSDKVYTSTDHPADQVINMHNEMCYATNWPMKIMFGCMEPSVIGGETPIADSRRVFRELSAATQAAFMEKGVKYVRNLSGELGLSWQQVFQTTDKKVVAEICSETEMQHTWIDEEHVRLEWVRPAIRQHPVTGEAVWFNHAFFFNEATLDPELRTIMDTEHLPFNTYYGDGSAISSQQIGEVAAAFAKHQVVFKWQKGDFLLLDNMLMAHGRLPFEGSRRIVVAMNEPHFPA